MRPVGLAALALVAVLGGAGRGEAVLLTGAISYQDYPFTNQCYTAPEFRPARFLAVEAVDPASGTVLASGFTDASGAFALEAPGLSIGQKVAVAFRAESAAVSVQDPTPPNSVYTWSTTDEPDTVTSDPFELGEARVTEEQNAGALNLHDVVAAASRYAEARANRVVAPVAVRWKRGHAAGTYYDSSRAEIEIANAGSRTWSDNDEYDDIIVLHEYAHHLERTLSCDASPGGAHSLCETTQDPHLAWSEGLADYLSVLLANLDPGTDHFGSWLVDLIGTFEAGCLLTTTAALDLEENTACGPVSDGRGSESAVSRILWDLTDGPADPPDAYQRSEADLFRVLVDLMPDAFPCDLDGFAARWCARYRAEVDAYAPVFDAQGYDVRTACAAVPPPTRTPASLVVPVALDLVSPFAHYRTELSLTNRSGSPIHVAVEYVPSLGSGGGVVDVPLRPGEQRIVPGILDFLRAAGLPIPPAEAESQAGVLALTAPAGALLATARTTSATAPPQPPGLAGVAYGATPLEEGIHGSATVYGLRESGDDRSSLAVYNVTAEPVTLRLVAHSGSGDGAVDVVRGADTLPAFGWRQYSFILQQAGFANGWVTVERTEGTGAFGVYGVVNDNATNDGSFLPAVPAGTGAMSFVIPVLVETPSFRSELFLVNRGPVPVTLSLSYVESLGPELGAGGKVVLTLGPRTQVILPEALDALRRAGLRIGPQGAASYAGALRVGVTGGLPADVFGGARTASRSPAGGQFGLFTPGLHRGGEAGESALVAGLCANATDRSNLALSNAGAGAVRLEVRVFDGEREGAPAGDVEVVSLGPGEWRQLLNPLAARGVRSGWARVRRLSGESGWLAYGVVNDGASPGERTGDGAYVPMVIVPAAD